jgi:hypothetical protein
MLKQHISIGVFSVYIDTGSPVPNIRQINEVPNTQCLFSRYLGVQLFIIYRIYDYDMLTLSQYSVNTGSRLSNISDVKTRKDGTWSEMT